MIKWIAKLLQIYLTKIFFGDVTMMTYRQYSNLRKSNTPEAVMHIRAMDKLQREIYERLFMHEIKYEKKMLGEVGTSPDAKGLPQ